MAADVPLITLDDVSVCRRGQTVVEHVSGQVGRGELLAVVGPNGAGKSTLFEALAGRVVLSGGDMRFVGGVRPAMAHLSQKSSIDRSFPVNVHDVVAMGAMQRVGAWRGFGRVDREAVAAALDRVGMAGLAARSLDALSGGQFQRMLFARLLLEDADLVLLDEPFAAVDEATVACLMGMIHAWHAAGRTVLVIVHDLALVRRHFPRTLLLAGEPVAWGDTAAVLGDGNLARAWQVPMMASRA